jgi:hypothetical protein
MREDIHFEEAPHCGVGKSQVCEGQGLFALKRFQPKERVASYQITQNLRKEYTFSRIPKHARETCWWVGKNQEVAEVFPPESLFMRANHSRKPNCRWNPREQTITALREIVPGEEITYDYRLEIAPPEIKSHPPDWA